ncbi:hypothetical protein CFAM422_004371 [Trichoderma lentiforme]|uniref:Uncharacterized protein n=1 Tax=Trichoderma lentiforme TaxID=1567552 RepID=A0A9P5CDE8_9HYPO|nr:hypothetical protein CFAM422_004371 [Trichoderma lentiforme]
MADAHKHTESSSAFEDRIEKAQNQAKRFATKVEEAFKLEKEAMEETFRSEKEAMKKTFESEKKAMEETFESEKKAMEETFKSKMKGMSRADANDMLAMAFGNKRALQLKDEAYAAIIRENLYAIDSDMTEETIQDKIEQAKTRSLEYFAANVFRSDSVVRFFSFE